MRRMRKSNEIAQRGRKGGTSAMAAGAAGAIVGAAVGSAAAMTFTNKQIRTQIGKTFNGIREVAVDTFEEMRKSTEDLSDAGITKQINRKFGRAKRSIVSVRKNMLKGKGKKGK